MKAPAGFLETMREAICRAEFRLTPHPVFSKTHGAWLVKQAQGQALAADAAALVKIGKRADPSAVYAVHARHAALGYAWIDNYASRLAELIDDIRFEAAARASNVEGDDDAIGLFGGGGDFALLQFSAASAFDAATDAFQLLDEARFRRVEDLSLAHLDFTEDVRVQAADAHGVRFACARCGAEMTQLLSKAGTRESCACGVLADVPVPSLQRVHRAAQAAREAAQGVTRCRICNQVVQTRKGPVERAGFCSKLCARDGVDRFREFIPEKSRRVGDEIRFACRCGAAITAGAGDAGSLMACTGCDLMLWVPPAGLDDGRPAKPVDCPKCAKKNRATLAACQYCGASLGA